MSSRRELSLAEPHAIERYARSFPAVRRHTVIRQTTRSGRDRFLYSRPISGLHLARQVRLLRQVSHENVVHVLRVMECGDSEHVLEIAEFMPLAVVDVCAKSFAAFDELALAAVLGQARGLGSDHWLVLTMLGFTGSDIHDHDRIRAD